MLVPLGAAMPQMTEQLELALFGPDEIREEAGSGEAKPTGSGNTAPGMDGLMDLVLAPENLRAALKRVRQNKGSPGVDGMRVEELGDWLNGNWERVREDLLSGRYVPSPVRRAEIPKAGGGMRQLGIPTVLDRLIQQMILQVLSPRIDPTFSAWSFGFRPGRSGQDAILAAHEMIRSGRKFVVDVDLKTFFDLVQHDVLMERLSRRIGDKVLLRLIRGYLQAGILAGGLVMERHEGTPQGGPLSPLLANILLDEIDQELERRGHCFVRYADDCNVYVHSQRAGERVMSLLRRLYGRLRLEVNEQKSAVAPVGSRKFLGYDFWHTRSGEVKRGVAKKTIVTFKQKMRDLTRRKRGKSLEQVVGDVSVLVRGWKGYFHLAQTPGVFRDLDKWIRHRLRAYQLRQWKQGRTIYRELRGQGASEARAQMVAGNCRRWWRTSATGLNSVMPSRFFDQMGLPRLAD
jgi:RNA-directed DNA polymerase